MSTIKVDTYLTRGGASEIAIDKLKGASSAGSMTVVGEGGSTTTNLQQGLVKAWNRTQDGNNISTDSFNISGTTDNEAGDFDIQLSNNMNNANYIVVTGADDKQDGGRAFASMFLLLYLLYIFAIATDVKNIFDFVSNI